MSIAAQYNKVGKLLRFLRDVDGEELGRLKAGYLWPPHVVLNVTSRCQLSCVHCTYANRDKDMSIPWDDVMALLSILERGGTRAIEHSGGEPTLYPHFAEMAHAIGMMGFKQGLLTNGLRLPEFEAVLGAFTWIRVSLDALTYGVDVPHFEAPDSVTVTASYVWGARSNGGALALAAVWCAIQGVKCRVVPDVWLPFFGAERAECRRVCESMGDAVHLIDRDDDRRPPVQCLSAWLKPMVGWDSYVYPCGYSTTYEWNRDIPPAFRLCHMRDFSRFFTETPIGDLGHRCSNCMGWEENDLLAAAMADVEHPEFF